MTTQKTLEALLQRLLDKLETQGGPDRIIRNAEIYEFCGLKRSQLGDLIERGDFPQPFRPAGPDGRVKAWFAREISEWQRRRLVERDDKPKRK